MDEVHRAKVEQAGANEDKYPRAERQPTRQLGGSNERQQLVPAAAESESQIPQQDRRQKVSPVNDRLMGEEIAHDVARRGEGEWLVVHFLRGSVDIMCGGDHP